MNLPASQVLAEGLTLAQRLLHVAPGTPAGIEPRHGTALARCWLELDERFRSGAPFPASWCIRRAPARETAAHVEGRRSSTSEALWQGLSAAKRIAFTLHPTHDPATVLTMARALCVLHLELASGTGSLPTEWLARPARLCDAQPITSVLT